MSTLVTRLDPTRGSVVRARRPGWLALVFLVSLILPGAGHLLRGRVRRGLAWALILTGPAVAILLVMPISFTTVAICVVVGPLAVLACALDTLRLSDAALSWGVALTSSTALVFVGWLVTSPFTTYYRTHYLQAFSIPSASMAPAIARGDFVLSNNSAYRVEGPLRRHIIVFKYPRDEQRDFVKRVVGLPGDRIAIRSGQVIVNGQSLDEHYVMPPAGGPSAGACVYAFGCDAAVPSDSYFVMGDNREHSQDSRHFGFIRRDKIVGRAFAI